MQFVASTRVFSDLRKLQPLLHRVFFFLLARHGVSTLHCVVTYLCVGCHHPESSQAEGVDAQEELMGTVQKLL